MEVQVTQENLARALGHVSRVAAPKAGLEILGNILLRTEKNQLRITATNLETAATQTIGAKVIKNGSFTIPARLVTETITSLPKDTISLKVDKGHLSITTSGNNTSINGVADDEFPELPEIGTPTAELTLPASDLKDLIAKTIIATSSDATRPVLTGVFWHTYGGQLYCAATDGYRLSEKRVMPLEGDVAAIIPTSTLQEVARSLDEETDIRVIFDDSQVVFEFENGNIISRLIDGKFPDYRQLIPKSTETTFLSSIDEVKRVVKLTGVFARDSGGSITISADAANHYVSVASVASEYGANTSEIKADVSGGGTVTLNARYLSDALGVIDGERFSFGFSGSISPCVLKADQKDTDYTHIIMPIKS